MILLFKNHTYVEIEKFSIDTSNEYIIYSINNLQLHPEFHGEIIDSAVICQYEDNYYLTVELHKSTEMHYRCGNSVVLQIARIIPD